MRKNKTIERGIYQRGPFSFQVKLMVDGHRIVGTFDSLDEARAFRDSKRAALTLDPDAKRLLETRAKRNDVKAATLSTILAATDVAASGGERGWWWRSVAGTLTLAGLAWVLVAGPTSPSVAATAASAVAAMLVASCVPAGLRWRLRPSGRRQGPSSAGPSTSTAEQPASPPAG